MANNVGFQESYYISICNIVMTLTAMTTVTTVTT